MSQVGAAPVSPTKRLFLPVAALLSRRTRVCYRLLVQFAILAVSFFLLVRHANLRGYAAAVAIFCVCFTRCACMLVHMLAVLVIALRCVRRLILLSFVLHRFV